MLRHMGELAGGLITGGKGSVMGVASRGHERDAFYSAILLSSSAEDVYQNVKTSTNLMIKIPLDHRSSLVWMAEYLEQNVTDPFHEWQRAGRPAYPDANTRQMMRQKQVKRTLNLYIHCFSAPLFSRTNTRKYISICIVTVI